MPVGLIALALGGFGIGLTEFVIMGLLPQVAADFHVTEATAGWLISGYALAVVVGALGLTAAVTRFERKPVLAVLMVLFIAGNLVSALAPDYSIMMVGRIIAALVARRVLRHRRRGGRQHGGAHQESRRDRDHVHRPDGSECAGRPVRHHAGPGRGLALHVLGDHRHRRPRPGRHPGPGPENRLRRDCRWFAAGSLRGELRAFRSGQVWLSIFVTILGYGGMFGAFTYIAFTLTEVTGFSAATVPWLLILFGVGLFIGNTLGGKAADKNVDRTLLVVLAVLVVVLVVFALTAGNQPMTIASMVLLGGFGFATVPGLQMRVMKYASSAPTLASGANIGAFNVGNALGAWMGGVTITAGLGYTSPIWAGAGITLLGLAVMAFAAAAAKKHDAGLPADVDSSTADAETELQPV